MHVSVHIYIYILTHPSSYAFSWSLFACHATLFFSSFIPLHCHCAGGIQFVQCVCFHNGSVNTAAASTDIAHHRLTFDSGKGCDDVSQHIGAQIFHATVNATCGPNLWPSFYFSFVPSSSRNVRIQCVYLISIIHPSIHTIHNILQVHTPSTSWNNKNWHRAEHNGKNGYILSLANGRNCLPFFSHTHCSFSFLFASYNSHSFGCCRCGTNSRSIAGPLCARMFVFIAAIQCGRQRRGVKSVHAPYDGRPTDWGCDVVCVLMCITLFIHDSSRIPCKYSLFSHRTKG